jgi:cytochrome P450
MALNPEVQKKAQAELDAVVGRDHPPRFQDLASLPYIHAIMKETLRWRPVAPLGM